MRTLKRAALGACEKVRARVLAGEAEGGAEVIEIVIGLGFAVGLGAVLLGLQGVFQTTITQAGIDVSNLFGQITGGSA